jgi:hypothetical protein
MNWKKVIGILSVATLAIALSACGGSKPRVDVKDMPEWVMNPPKSKGVIYGTGIAEQGSLQLAKEAADLRAKKEIAAVMGGKVNAMLKDYLRQAAIGEPAEQNELVESVTRSLTDLELVGVEIEKREYINGKMYSLAKYSIDGGLAAELRKAANKALVSKEALLADFRAKQGFEELDRQVEKLKEQ